MPEHPQSPYTLINVFTPKDGETDRFIALQLDETRKMRDRAARMGWLNNEVYRSHDGKTVVAVTRFSSVEAQQCWAQSPDFQEHLDVITPFLDHVQSTPVMQVAAHQAPAPLRLGVIIGSTRANRFADHPAQWIATKARATGLFDVELIDLRDHPLPFFGDTATTDAEHEAITHFANRIARFDAYVMTVAEYNHAPTAVLKNALDHGSWQRKPAAFVGYGGVGGARAVEQLRAVAAELEMVTMQTAVHIVFADYLQILKGEREIRAFEHLEKSADRMLEQLGWWARVLRNARGAHERRDVHERTGVPSA